MEKAAGGGQDCGRERSVGIRDGGETEVAEGAGEQIEVVLFFSDAPIMIFLGRFRYRFFSSKLADSDSDTDFFSL